MCVHVCLYAFLWDSHISTAIQAELPESLSYPAIFEVSFVPRIAIIIIARSYVVLTINKFHTVYMY